MATKARKRVHPMPRLGWKDNLLYWVGLILSFCGCFFGMLIPIWVQKAIAFSDSDVVARVDGPGNLFCYPLCVWGVVFGVTVLACYRERRPVFGRKDIQYGPPAYPRVYPLLMKNKPRRWVSPKAAARKKKGIIALTAILFGTFMFSAIVYPMSFSGRKVLLRDGSVAVYNSFDKEKVHYKPQDFDAVMVQTRYQHRKNGGAWVAEVVFEASDGAQIQYSIGSFEGDVLKSLQNMLTVRQRYGDRVMVGTNSNLEEIVFQYDMTAAERAILYQIFS